MGDAQNYNFEFLEDVQKNPAKWMPIKQQIASEWIEPMIQKLNEMADELAENHQVNPRAGRVFVAQQMYQAARTVLYLQAAEAKAAGMTDEDVAHAAEMGRDGAETQERWPDIDKAVRARQRVSDTFEPVSIDFGHGFTVQMRISDDPRFDE